MGICQSAADDDFYADFVAVHQKLVGVFRKLGISDAEAKILYKFFRDLDRDRSGHVDMAEFLATLELDDTPFVKRLWSLMDADGSGELDFPEFVLSCWNYLTYSRSGLVAFAFELFDKDGGGVLEVSEIKAMVGEIYGDKGDDDRIRLESALEALRMQTISLGLKGVTKESFELWAVEHPIVLEPALNFQTDLRMAVLGTEFWDGIAARRTGLRSLAATKALATRVQEEKAAGFGAIGPGVDISKGFGGDAAGPPALDGYDVDGEDAPDKEFERSGAAAAASFLTAQRAKAQEAIYAKRRLQIEQAERAREQMARSAEAKKVALRGGKHHKHHKHHKSKRMAPASSSADLRMEDFTSASREDSRGAKKAKKKKGKKGKKKKGKKGKKGKKKKIDPDLEGIIDDTTGMGELGEVDEDDGEGSSSEEEKE